MMIDVLRPPFCKCKVKWAERRPKVMKRKMKHPSDMPTLRYKLRCICGPTHYQLEHGGAMREGERVGVCFCGKH